MNKRTYKETFGDEPFFRAKIHKQLCGVNAINNCFATQLVTLEQMSEEIRKLRKKSHYR